MTETRTETELFVAYLDGDSAAFEQLFARVGPKLLRLIARDFRHRQHAEELVQETFVRAIRAGRDFQRDRPLMPWLVTIALNVRREASRRQRRRPRADDGQAPESLAAPPERWDQQYDAQRTVHRAMKSLPESQRVVIELHWFAGLSFSEISQTLGIQLSAAKVRAHRGYKSMRTHLEAREK